jgi:hypothetical protein
MDSYLASAAALPPSQTQSPLEDDEEQGDTCQWEKPIMESFLRHFTTSQPEHPHLPMVLSPLSLVLSLATANYLIDASSIYWKVLQLPQAAFRNDVAAQILKNHLDLQLDLDSSSRFVSLPPPFYLENLPEVESGVWGWWKLRRQTSSPLPL